MLTDLLAATPAALRRRLFGWFGIHDGIHAWCPGWCTCRADDDDLADDLAADTFRAAA